MKVFHELEVNSIDASNCGHGTPGPAVVCLVTAEEEFSEEFVPELLPWFQVVVRPTCQDLVRWTREAQVVAALIDIDTDGADPHAGLTVIDERRRLNEGLVLISVSRSRRQAIEKSALEGGADAHFHSPGLIRGATNAGGDFAFEAGKSGPRSTPDAGDGKQQFQDFMGASETMCMVYAAIQHVADSSMNELIRGESGTTCTLRVKGHLKGPDAIDQFDAAVQAAFDSEHFQLLLNLWAMPIIDSSGIVAIVNALVQAKKLGGEVKLVNPSPFALKTLKMVSILNLFGVLRMKPTLWRHVGARLGVVRERIYL